VGRLGHGHDRMVIGLITSYAINALPLMLCQKKKDRQYNSQKKKRTKGQTMINKTLHSKLKFEQHEPQ
jgi:hypothetical protein